MRATGEQFGADWWLILRLSLVGFFVHCQPSEPFLTKYLEDVKGISDQDLDDYVWPCDTYGSFAFLLPVGLLADLAGYRLVVFLGLLCREATRLLLIFGEGVPQMALMQLTYAGATSAHSVYLAYTYMVVPHKDFHVATAALVAASHLGNAFGSILCQVLDSLTDISRHLHYYFYLSWGFTTIGLVCFALLPAPRSAPPPSLVSVVKNEGPVALWSIIKAVYSQSDSAMWSLWWLAGGVTMPYIIGNYYQTQFQDRWADGPVCLPALVMEVLSILGAVLSAHAMASSGPLFAACLCGMLGGLYWLPTVQHSAWTSYACNTLAVAIYNFQYTTASAKIAAAAHHGDKRYAVVFTANQCVALGLAAIVNAIGSYRSIHTDTYFQIAGIVELALAALLAAGGLAITFYHKPAVHAEEREHTPCNDIEDVAPYYRFVQAPVVDIGETGEMAATDTA